MRLVYENGQATGNSLNVDDSDLIRRWRAIKIPRADLRMMHPNWRSFHAISEFAREFSPAGLAKQLAVIASADPLLETELFRGLYPWQINACLDAKKAGVPLSASFRLSLQGN